MFPIGSIAAPPNPLLSRVACSCALISCVVRVPLMCQSGIGRSAVGGSLKALSQSDAARPGRALWRFMTDSSVGGGTDAAISTANGANDRAMKRRCVCFINFFFIFMFLQLATNCMIRIAWPVLLVSAAIRNVNVCGPGFKSVPSMTVRG